MKIKLKDKVKEVIKNILNQPKSIFFCLRNNSLKEGWVEKNYPEVKSRKKMIVKEVLRVHNSKLKGFNLII